MFTLLGGLSFGQTGTGSLSGRILDSSEAAVPDANVVLHSAGTDFSSSAVSAGDGVYRLDSVHAGRYWIIVRHPGFADTKQELTVNGGQQLRVDLHLRPEELNESITVTAEPGYVTADSSTATKLSTSWLKIPQDVEVVNRQILDEQANFQLGDAMHNGVGSRARKRGRQGIWAINSP